MEYSEIIAKVAEEVGLSKTKVDRIYHAYWKAIRHHITTMPLKEKLTEEEFLKLRPNVNIPSLGKIYITWDSYRTQRWSFEKFQGNYNKDKHKKKEDVTHKESNADVH